MKVTIKNGYTDRILRRNVRAGEELEVSEQRARELEEKGLAEIVPDVAAALAALTEKAAELEAAVTDRDKRIAELEAELAKKQPKQ